ncbi:MAG: dynamin family protein [Planctomycetaceae bacterium]|nr:dynamin family protein [Planctomycetaceae bacterium]
MSATIVKILDELLILVSESEKYHGASTNTAHKAFHKILTDVRFMLAEIRRRSLAASQRYVVAIVGLTNVGKSTLLNALFDQDLAPRRNGPCTAAPIEFIYGEEYQVSVHYFAKLKKPEWQCPNTESVHERLKALADSSGAEQSRSIQRVVVHAPLPLLKNGLVIADTPGFGAAQLDGAEGSHEESLKTYLTESVSQVFWIVLAEHGILRSEKDFHDKFFGQLCDDVIVTGCDDWEQRDKDRFRQRFSQTFQNRLPTFHFASGKLGIEAHKTGNVEELEQAGIPAIEKRIESLANIEDRVASIETTVLELAKDLKEWYVDFCNQHNTRRVSFWRPDSFDRWLLAHLNNPLHKHLVEILKHHQEIT